MSFVVGAPWRCGVLTTQGGIAGIGLGRLLGGEHASTHRSGVGAPRLLQSSRTRLCNCCCFWHELREVDKCMFAIRCLIGKGALDGIKNVSRNTRISSISRHPASRLGFLELAVIRSWWGTYVSYNCSVSQDRRRIDSLHCSWFLLMLRRKFFQSSLFFSIFFLKAASFSILQFLGNFSHSFLDKKWSFISYSLHKRILSRRAWSAYGLASHNCHLWGSSSRCDSNNAYSEFLRSKFWISTLYSVRSHLLWSGFSPRRACWALVQGVLGELVRQNRILCESEENDSQDCSVDFSLTSTLQHWSQNLLSLCLSNNRFPDACFLCFCVFREVRDFIEVWIVNEHRVTVHRSDLVELLGLKTCVGSGLGQIAKLLAARAEMRMPCACRTGKHGKNVWTSKSGMVSKWPSRNSKDGWDMRLEKARWRHVTHVQRTLLAHLSQPCVCDTHEKCAKYAVSALCAEKMCVQQVSVCTLSVAHTVVATSCVRNPLKKLCQEKIDIHHSMITLAKKFLQFVVRVRNTLKNSQTSSFHVHLDLSY